MANKQTDIYASFNGLMLAFGGMIGGVLAWLVFFGGDKWALPYCLMSGWLTGLPAAWLTARSIRKRNLRRDWRGCLKTAAFGAWWGAAATGGLLLLVAAYFVLTIPNFDPHPSAASHWTDRIDAGLIVGLSSVCGAVAAGILSPGLPEAEAPK